MAFEDTPNKATIRTSWDDPLIRRWAARESRPLTYFGLPGPEIRDLIAWRDMLDARRTGVEEVGSGPRGRERADAAASRMVKNAMVQGLGSGLQILRGDIADIILNATDVHGTRPLMADDQPVQHAQFRYDLINLDFDGGLGYQGSQQREAKRVTALKRLIERQKGHSFLLLLTLNVRHRLEDQMREFLCRLENRFGGRRDMDTAIHWFAEQGPGCQDQVLRATVPYVVRSAGELHGFDVWSHPPVAYTGHRGARMVHFAFELTWQHANLPAVSPQDESGLLGLPLIECDEGELQVCLKQSPSADLSQLPQVLDFLRPNRVHSICSVVPTGSGGR
ncbi:hypothetical protein BH23GEM7_BH23GEM7_30700 [soil metagenome]|nr:hypothetical protein [Gemmatimonadota bacterium]